MLKKVDLTELAIVMLYMFFFIATKKGKINKVVIYIQLAMISTRCNSNLVGF